MYIQVLGLFFCRMLPLWQAYAEHWLTFNGVFCFDRSWCCICMWWQQTWAVWCWQPEPNHTYSYCSKWALYVSLCYLLCNIGDTQGVDPIEYFRSMPTPPPHSLLDTPQLQTLYIFYVYCYTSIDDEISTSNRSVLWNILVSYGHLG